MEFRRKTTNNIQKPLMVLLLDLDGTVVFDEQIVGQPPTYITKINAQVLRFSRHFDLVVPFSKTCKKTIIHNFFSHPIGELDYLIQVDNSLRYTLRQTLVQVIEAHVGKEKIPFVALTPDVREKKVGTYYNSLNEFEKQFKDIVCQFLKIAHGNVKVNNAQLDNKNIKQLLEKINKEFSGWQPEKEFPDLAGKTPDEAYTKRDLFLLVEDELKAKYPNRLFNYTWLDDKPEATLRSSEEGKRIHLLEVDSNKSYYEYLFQHFKRAGKLTFTSTMQEENTFKVFLSNVAQFEQQMAELMNGLVNYLVQSIEKFADDYSLFSKPNKQGLQEQVQQVINNSRTAYETQRDNFSTDQLNTANAAAFNNFNTKCQDSIKKKKIIQAMDIYYRLEYLPKGSLHNYTQGYCDNPANVNLNHYLIGLWQTFSGVINSAIIDVATINDNLPAYKRQGELMNLLIKFRDICAQALTPDSAQNKFYTSMGSN